MRQLEEHAVATMPHEPVNGSEEFARELLDRVRAVLVGVPAGPWTLQGWGEQNQNGDYAESILFDGDGETMTYGLADREGDFIAQARTLVPELAAELDRWLAVVAEFRRRDASAERLITRLKAERAQLNEYIGDLDREIDHPLTVEAQDAGRRIRSASGPGAGVRRVHREVACATLARAPARSRRQRRRVCPDSDPGVSAMTTEPYADLLELEHPGPYDQSGAKFRECPTCGAKPMTKLPRSGRPAMSAVRAWSARSPPGICRAWRVSRTNRKRKGHSHDRRHHQAGQRAAVVGEGRRPARRRV
ncbi:MAG: hypothetical protein U5N53_28425 [Mycobacterium sp.]|nr:hypothetical protein [Mycobacterium sp.]